MSVPVRSTLRYTLLWAVVPAAIVYAVALVWSGTEGISAKLVLKDLAQSFKAPWEKVSSPAWATCSGWRQRPLPCLRRPLGRSRAPF